MARYTTLLFDFDGTIANTTPSIIYCLQKLLRSKGIEVDDEMIARNTGLSLVEGFQLLANTSDMEKVKRYTEEYKELYFHEGTAMIELFPAVAETMRQLHENGIRMALSTNNFEYIVTPVIERLGIMPYMNEIVCSDSTNVKNVKPAPDIAIEAMRRTNSLPEKTLVVGDSAYDIQMGVAAGTATCGVTFGSHSKERLLEAGATHTIDSFDELLKIVLE